MELTNVLPMLCVLITMDRIRVHAMTGGLEMDLYNVIVSIIVIWILGCSYGYCWTSTIVRVGRWELLKSVPTLFYKGYIRIDLRETNLGRNKIRGIRLAYLNKYFIVKLMNKYGAVQKLRNADSVIFDPLPSM